MVHTNSNFGSGQTDNKDFTENYKIDLCGNLCGKKRHQPQTYDYHREKAIKEIADLLRGVDPGYAESLLCAVKARIEEMER